MRTDVSACNCTRGCTDTKRESALKVDSGKKIPCHTRESNLHQPHDSLMLYQLHYIPSHCFDSMCLYFYKQQKTKSNGGSIIEKE